MKKTILLLFVSLQIISWQANALTCKTTSTGQNHLLQKCETMNVLTLTGNPIERARTHGALMKNYLSRDVYNYFANRLTEEMDHFNFFVKHFTKLVYGFWVDRFYSKTPHFLYDEMLAQAQGAEVDFDAMKRAIALPDTSNILVNYHERGFFKTFVTFGCTSVSRKSQDGNFVYARNLDFPSATIYDKNPLITIQIPEEGSKELRHITFAADGIQFGGITGVNEAGIAFAVHQLSTRDSNTFGMPMLFVGELVLRQAKSLEDAVEIIKIHPPGPMWVFVITDLNKQESWSVEASATEVSVRKMIGDLHVQTNHMLAADRSQKEIAYSGHGANSRFRMQMAEQIISQGKSVTALQGAQVLSFQTNPMGELSTSQDILKGETIQSLIFEMTKKSKKLFIGFDSAPVASGRYLEFDFAQLLEAKPELNYEIQDFLRTDSVKRMNQLKIAQAASLLDRGNITAAAEQFAGQTTFDAQIFQAIAFLKTDRPQKALEVVQKINLETAQASNEMKQAKPWLELVSMLKLGLNEPALKLATELKVEEIKDAEFKKLIDIVRKREFTRASGAELNYSLFSGYLSQKPGL